MNKNKELPLYLIKDIIKYLCFDFNRKNFFGEDELNENNKFIVNLALVNWEFFKTLSNNLTTSQDFNFIPDNFYPTNPMSESNISSIKNQDKSDFSIYRLENIKLLKIESKNYATCSSEKEIEISNFLNDAISKCANLNSIYIDLQAFKNGYSNSSMQFLNSLKVNENVSIEIKNLKLLKLDSKLPKNVNKIGVLIVDKIDPKLYKINNLKDGDKFIKIDSLRIQGSISDFNWNDLILSRKDLLPIYNDIEELKVDNIDISSLLSLLLLTPTLKKLTVTFCFDSLMKKLNQTSKQSTPCECDNNFLSLNSNVDHDWKNLINSVGLLNLRSLSIVDRCSDVINEMKRCKNLIDQNFNEANFIPIQDQDELQKKFNQDLKNLEEYPLILEFVSCFKNLKQFDIKAINSIKPIISLIKSNKSIENYKVLFQIYNFNNKKEKFIQLLDQECRNNDIIESLIIDQEFFTDLEDKTDYTYNNIFKYKKD
ncbi:hypothetical protein ACTFIZ_006761 [Dictyostelium cf. discoideum]